MPSHSLVRWIKECAKALDDIEAVHCSIGGSKPGRRYAMQQINYAYAVILSSQFQAFYRDLHSEVVDYFLRGIESQSR